jgi:voltage-gated potassium channel
VLAGGSIIVAVETGVNKKMFSEIFDGFWWTVVTVTSVGYGDKVPVTALGKVFAIALMLIGVVVTSILSGTIASIFVDRKIREGRGLQDVKLRGHIVVCGWNTNAESILRGLDKVLTGVGRGIVLINEMDAEEFQILKMHYPDMDVRFVRGDFTNENVLKRGSVATARSAIVVSDSSGQNTIANADERTILASLALKSLNPNISTSAELVNPENEQHLKRANVDNILVNGEFNGFLFANSTTARGIPLLIKELLSFESRTNLTLTSIPPNFVGKSFGELMDHFLKTGKGILIGLLSEEKKISLDDILSEDTSAIDTFIKRKFAEAEIDLGDEEKEQEQILLNPDPDHIISETESAFLIGSSESG